MARVGVPAGLKEGRNPGIRVEIRPLMFPAIVIDRPAARRP